MEPESAVQSTDKNIVGLQRVQSSTARKKLTLHRTSSTAMTKSFERQRTLSETGEQNFAIMSIQANQRLPRFSQEEEDLRITSVRSFERASNIQPQPKATEKVLKWSNFAPPIKCVEEEIEYRPTKNTENISRVLRPSQWTHKSDFLMESFGVLIGLGNFLRFPYLCCKYSGGAFIFAYVFSFFIIGIPLFLAEMTAGQFADQYSNCWMFCPMLRGIAFLFILIQTYSCVYYVLDMSWAMLYLSYCFLQKLPWSHCGSPWASELCRQHLIFVTRANCTGNLKPFKNGTCYSILSKRLVGIYNKTLAAKYGIREKMPAEDFLKYSSLKFGYSSGIHDIGPIQWQICLALGLIWLLIFIFQFKKIKRLLKTAYVFVGFSIIGMLLLLIKALTLKGSKTGIRFYFHLNAADLMTGSIWYDAAEHVVFSLSLAVNVLPYLSSHNVFNHNIVRDTVLLTFADLLTSFIAGLAFFSCAGALEKETDIKISDFVSSETRIGFVAYPQLLVHQSAPHFWCFTLFLTMVSIGLENRIIGVEVITANLCYLFTFPEKYRNEVSAVLVFSFYLLGLSMTTPGSIYIITLLSEFTYSWNAIFGLLLMMVAVALYGFKRFSKNIGLMVATSPLRRFLWKFMKWYFVICWSTLTPLFLLFVCSVYFIQYTGTKYESYVFPGWAVLIVAVFPAVSVAMPFVLIIWDAISRQCNMLRMLGLIKPDNSWTTDSDSSKSRSGETPNKQFRPLMAFFNAIENKNKSLPPVLDNEYICSSVSHYKIHYPSSLSDNMPYEGLIREDNTDENSNLSPLSFQDDIDCLSDRSIPGFHEITKTAVDDRGAPTRTKSKQKRTSKIDSPKRSKSKQKRTSKTDSPKRSKSKQKRTSETDSPKRSKSKQKRTSKTDSPKRSKSKQKRTSKTDTPKRTNSIERNSTNKDTPKRTKSLQKRPSVKGALKRTKSIQKDIISNKIQKSGDTSEKHSTQNEPPTPSDRNSTQMKHSSTSTKVQKRPSSRKESIKLQLADRKDSIQRSISRKNSFLDEQPTLTKRISAPKKLPFPAKIISTQRKQSATNTGTQKRKSVTRIMSMERDSSEAEQLLSTIHSTQDHSHTHSRSDSFDKQPRNYSTEKILSALSRSDSAEKGPIILFKRTSNQRRLSALSRMDSTEKERSMLFNRESSARRLFAVSKRNSTDGERSVLSKRDSNEKEGSNILKRYIKDTKLSALTRSDSTDSKQSGFSRTDSTENDLRIFLSKETSGNKAPINPFYHRPNPLKRFHRSVRTAFSKRGFGKKSQLQNTPDAREESEATAFEDDEEELVRDLDAPMLHQSLAATESKPESCKGSGNRNSKINMNRSDELKKINSIVCEANAVELISTETLGSLDSDAPGCISGSSGMLDSLASSMSFEWFD